MATKNRELKRAALKEMAELSAKDRQIIMRHDTAGEKLEIARQVAEICAAEFKDNKSALTELMAADNTDANLGALSGTLVAMKAMENFRYQLDYIQAIYTDFREEPAALGQDLKTRIILTPGVQLYDKTINANTGMPNGFSYVTPPQALDVNVNMSALIGVPIRFGLDILSSTFRNLFNEYARAASYAMGKYFSNLVLGCLTPANFNAYAAVNGAKVPAAYATFPVGVMDFARSSLTKISGILTKNEVPTTDRFVLLNVDYHSQLSNDPSISQFYAAMQKPDIITDSNLPRLARFTPFEVPNLAENNATPNLVGFAGHRASIVAVMRPPVDLNEALPDDGARYGASNMVTDPVTGLTMLLVQYVNQVNGYAEWRLMGIVGAAPGDKRGGLCITSQ